MARKKIIETTATEAQTQRAEGQNAKSESEEVSDPYEFFRDEACECLIALRRIEPVIERGTHVAGHLPSLTLSPDEARNLAATLMSRPGYGGGLYHLQCQRRIPGTGKYVFAAGFRFRVAGPSRALEIADTPPQAAAPMAAAQPVPQAAAMAPSYPPPPPWYHQPPQPIQQPIQQAQLMSELPRLLQGLGEFVRSQSSAPNLDVVNVIQALQNTVKGEDDFAKFQKFLTMMRHMQHGQIQPEPPSALASVDWGAVVGTVKDILRPAAPAAIPPGPPGWNWDAGAGRYVKAPPSTTSQPGNVPPPRGWKWENGQWVKTSGEETHGENEDEEEDEDEDEEEDDSPLNADEMAELVLRNMERMPETEQARLREMARAMFG